MRTVFTKDDASRIMQLLHFLKKTGYTNWKAGRIDHHSGMSIGASIHTGSGETIYVNEEHREIENRILRPHIQMKASVPAPPQEGDIWIDNGEECVYIQANGQKVKIE